MGKKKKQANKQTNKTKTCNLIGRVDFNFFCQWSQICLVRLNRIRPFNLASDLQFPKTFASMESTQD